MPPQVISYGLDDSTVVRFEVEESTGFHPARAGGIAGSVPEAVTPAVAAARAVLDKFKEARPDEVELKFGVKVSGTANWLVAKAAAEGNFEVTLVWRAETGEAR